MAASQIPRAALALAILTAPTVAQQQLSADVEAYFSVVEDEKAAALLTLILQREDATPEALLELVRTPPPLAPGQQEFRFPHNGLELVATLHVPEGHTHSSSPLPTVMDIQAGNMIALADFSASIWVMVSGYKPEQFSEHGRDGFLKAVRTAAFRANGGDLWLGGYSWAGHATWGTALHRPGFLRGIVPSGGGPRRPWFRLIPNLDGVRILQFCGEKDDPELVWNLREVGRAFGKGLDYSLSLDPRFGHEPNVQGFSDTPKLVAQTPLSEPRTSGTLYAAGPFVENPWIRILDVTASAVRVPKRVRVTARMTADEQRRAVLRSMVKKVATVEWSLDRGGDATTLRVRPRSVRQMTLFVRASDVAPGGRVTVLRGSKRVFDGPVTVDRRALLTEARRTGERRNPTVMRFAVGR